MAFHEGHGFRAFLLTKSEAYRLAFAILASIECAPSDEYLGKDVELHRLLPVRHQLPAAFGVS
jgi:hypothetical protein